MTTACNEKALLSLQCKRTKYMQSNNEQIYTCIYRYVKPYTFIVTYNIVCAV